MPETVPRYIVKKTRKQRVKRWEQYKTMNSFLKELQVRVRLGQLNDHSVKHLVDLHGPRIRQAEAEGKQRAKHMLAWRELLKPLTNEMSSVRAGLLYFQKKDNAEFLAAYGDYWEILIQLYSMLTAYKTNGVRVDAAVYDFEQQIKKSLPNGGKHWTDWVAPATKRRIHVAIANLPYKAHARKREPFRRGDKEKTEFNWHRTKAAKNMKDGWMEDGEDATSVEADE